MPDTYLSFCLGYGIFLALLFALMGLTLCKVLRLEKEISNLQK
jgi:hypothetical protein